METNSIQLIWTYIPSPLSLSTPLLPLGCPTTPSEECFPVHYLLSCMTFCFSSVFVYTCVEQISPKRTLTCLLNFLLRQFSEGIGTCRRNLLAQKWLTVLWMMQFCVQNRAPPPPLLCTQHGQSQAAGPRHQRS